MFFVVCSASSLSYLCLTILFRLVWCFRSLCKASLTRFAVFRSSHFVVVSYMCSDPQPFELKNVWLYKWFLTSLTLRAAADQNINTCHREAQHSFLVCRSLSRGLPQSQTWALPRLLPAEEKYCSCCCCFCWWKQRLEQPRITSLCLWKGFMQQLRKWFKLKSKVSPWFWNYLSHSQFYLGLERI